MNVSTVSPRSTPEAASRLPELLAPAGDWECAKAAVENGADAIYFGLSRFNARMRAQNFTEADLPRLLAWLHRRGVKAYVTFNTLVFQNELIEAEQSLRAIIAAGVDAAIVQDIGICRLIRQLSPDFPIHASTQMTITSAAGVEFARELGCQLVVLARECSIKEIAVIRTAASTATTPSALPLEVFVHGALCVAYSGQCLTSEALGGRSANRGECAQACRLPYDLICDGQPVSLGDRRYLLSPQDLAGLDVLPDLVRAGVSSLKIEGRLKSPEYVANITRVYRAALDRLGERQVAAPTESADSRYEMEMAFSRGLHTGWLAGIDNQRLVHARFGKKRGVYLGEVRRVQSGRVWVRLEAPLKPGDGIVFDAGRPDEPEEGGRVYGIETRNAERGTRNTSEATLSFGHGEIDFARVQPGDKIWKTSDPELERHLRQTFAGDAPRFARPIHMEVRGRAGEPLSLFARDDSGRTVEVQSETPLAVAERQPLTEQRLREQLGRLGGTPFCLGELRAALEGAVILPVSELNRLRRLVVEHLESARAQSVRWTLTERFDRGTGSTGDSPVPPGHWPGGTEERRVLERSPGDERSSLPFRSADRRTAQAGGPCDPAPSEAELIVLVRNLPQLAATLRSGVTTIYCEFENPKHYRDAVATVRAHRASTDTRPVEVFVAPPRIFKTGEEWILRLVRSSEADGYLVRNYDHLKFFATDRRVGDFSLNVANALTADYFMRCFNLERLTASYDLNCTQLEALLGAAPPEWFEITVHQHMPMFHMEHCVFCAFLSSGTDYTNCGRPCDRHDVRLRDRAGAEHALKADAGCRNTVFNARAQTGAEYVERLLALGARRFRIEFLHDPPDRVTHTIAHYRRLLRGETTGAELWRELKLLNQLGVTRGALGTNEHSTAKPPK